MSLKHLKLLDEDDEDPMLSAVNLVDVFLVLVVALLAAVAASTRQAAAPEPGRVSKAGAPDMEIVVAEQGREVRYKGQGSVSEGQGVRAGVAYRLRDGSIIYVPEGDDALATSSAGDAR